MIRKLMAAAAVAGLLAATPSMAANSCRDAKGKFVPCKTVVTKKTTTKVTTMTVKGKDGKCRFASGPKKGQFTRCP
ncbi:MAG: hypothetical protein K0R64_494 [Novosphingobium lindaniclasticum]|jgi:hypothetical protein|uniref:Uncharacterized protein n=1 Tax=Novosphingobium lindaniclasticum LE124 TaxID=1096930 RepID=T0J5G0_9SPHN|nr:hypothetical protein [Novosphingobium lindaniclasticum]EQB19385.1 hypothetical protein L284_02165 [Novosphingobium lindaniclasticum LE124]MDF2637510.1 hypothetical protein [Novosphingobium lindaniclasticum]